MKRKGLYAVMGVFGAVVILLAAVGVAYAQEPPPPREGRAYGAGGLFSSGAGGKAGPGRGWGWGMRGASLMDAVAKASDMSVDEVAAALEGGQTPIQLLRSRGVDAQAVVDLFLAGRRTALEEAVAEGRLTPEQAEQMLTNMADHLLARLEQPWTPRQDGGRMGGNCGRWSGSGSDSTLRSAPGW